MLFTYKLHCFPVYTIFMLKNVNESVQCLCGSCWPEFTLSFTNVILTPTGLPDSCTFGVLGQSYHYLSPLWEQRVYAVPSCKHLHVSENQKTVCCWCSVIHFRLHVFHCLKYLDIKVEFFVFFSSATHLLQSSSLSSFQVMTCPPC